MWHQYKPFTVTDKQSVMEHTYKQIFLESGDPKIFLLGGQVPSRLDISASWTSQAYTKTFCGYFFLVF